VLAIFNLLPIPPLDGSRIVDRLIPYSLRRPWDNFCRMGPIALAAVILVPQFLHVSLLGGPVAWVTSWLEVLLNWLAG
jgi:Zn-dependent protease